MPAGTHKQLRVAEGGFSLSLRRRRGDFRRFLLQLSAGEKAEFGQVVTQGLQFDGGLAFVRVGDGAGEQIAALKLARRCRSLSAMSVTAEKIAVEALALPAEDRAFLARQLIASLDSTVDADAETQWHEVIDRRSREIEEGKVSCRPVEQVVQDIRNKFHARRQPS
jgi:putative addiction module component (TIGR02574 family)